MNVRLKQLSKSYGGQIVLRGLDLQVENIHGLVLIGPSGCGKSTLLRILGGLEIPNQGSVEINGRALPLDEAGLREHRRKTGMVFQAFNLFPHLTALDNIKLPLIRVHGQSNSEAEENARSILRRLRLDGHEGKRPAELSGGQSQRVAIARALAVRPDWILFDEPTSALDPEMVAEVLDVIRELREEGRDLVLVTHQISFAKRVADQVVMMADGRIMEAGPAEQVFENPQSDACREFLGKVLKY